MDTLSQCTFQCHALWATHFSFAFRRIFSLDGRQAGSHHPEIATHYKPAHAIVALAVGLQVRCSPPSRPLICFWKVTARALTRHTDPHGKFANNPNRNYPPTTF